VQRVWIDCTKLLMLRLRESEKLVNPIGLALLRPFNYSPRKHCMDYSENFYGIKYKAERGGILEIRASMEDFTLDCWDGVLNLMSSSVCGRTAVFMADCDFFTTSREYVIKVQPGTASYIKELSKVRKVSKHEYDLHKLSRLW
jgi:hypothetical protein